MDWQPIETAPRDGREVWVKRVYEDRVVKEGWAVFDTLADAAPMRQSADGGLYAPIPPDHKAADAERWSNPDRLHRFPTPTHWLPEPPEAGLVERIARAIAADQSKRLYGIDRGADEAWESCTDYGRQQLLADAAVALATARAATR